MEGFVTKRGHLITNWKVRWFVLEGGAVKYYQDRTLQKLKGTYFLRPDTVATHHSDMGLNRNVILLFTTSHRFRKRALYFSCDSVETKDAWMTAITKEVEEIKLSGNTHVQAPSENIAGPVDKLGNTLARIFTGEKAEGEESVPVASPTAADEEELQRGRAKQVRPGSSGRDGTVTGEFLDRGRTPQAKSSKQISKMKRLPNSTAAGHQVPINANPVAEAGTLQQDYTAEYDTSDTDNSDGEARGKSQSSTTSTSNSHSSALAADAANSPILQKLKEKHAAAQSADDLSHLQSRVSLPRVSLIAAEEAAQASHKKMNFNNTSAKTAAVNARSRPTVVAEEVNKPSAASTEMHKQPSVTSRGANSSAAVAAETTAKDRRSSGNNSASLPPEQSDNPWIEVCIINCIAYVIYTILFLK